MFADGALNQIGVFKALMGVDAKALLRVHAWKTVEEAQRQWAGQLVARALQNDAPCSFALEVETCLVETMGCTVAADVILGIGWTSLRNWLNGLVLLRALERSLGDENQELRDRIKDFRECERAKAGVRNGFPTEIDITRFLCQ
jgi:hypothetical protein